MPPLPLIPKTVPLPQTHGRPPGTLPGRIPVPLPRSTMGNTLYVGNLTFQMTATDLQRLFEAHGTVVSAEVIADRDTNRSKGFGFVEMGSDTEVQAAIRALHGQDLNGRQLLVNEA